jgi:hypothetical protein
MVLIFSACMEKTLEILIDSPDCTWLMQNIEINASIIKVTFARGGRKGHKSRVRKPRRVLA